MRGQRIQRAGRARAILGAASLAVTLLVAPAGADHRSGQVVTYSAADLIEDAQTINLLADEGGVRLDDRVRPFPFVWVAVSGKGTVVRIDAATGEIVGEYRTAPEGRGLNPSRTTVDKAGNVWVANRNEAGTVPNEGAMGSVVHVGLLENGQCEDRNGNGVIDTSAGLGDVRDWPNTDAADTYGGTSTAADECILHYTRTHATGTRHVSVTKDNDIWVSGTGSGRDFDLIDGETGEIIRTETGVGCGGYGGLIDPDGVIWSARPLLRWDTSLPLVSGNYRCYAHDSYGLAIDGEGNVWNTAFAGDAVRKFAPDGTLLGTFRHGNYYAQGVVADGNGDVWVAHSLYRSSVGRLRNDGTLVGTVAVGCGPTGVAVDADGKVWATNDYDRTVSRIDPSLNGGVGGVDLTTADLGGALDNYSDMTGSVLVGAPDEGTLTLVHDSLEKAHVWESVAWDADVPAGSGLDVTVASSEDAGTFIAPVAVEPGAALDGLAPGRYLQIQLAFDRAPSGETPVLHSLTIGKLTSRLEAHAAVAEAVLPDGRVSTVFPELSARLTEHATGASLAGRDVVFRADDGTVLCTARTGADGSARCGGGTQQSTVLAGGGFEAVFRGDAVTRPSADDGRLVRIVVEQRSR